MNLTYANINKAVNAASDILALDSNAIDVEIYRDATDTTVGACMGDHEDVTIQINQHLNGNDWVEVLAHELIHAAQYLQGRLADATPGFITFDGTTYQSPLLAKLTQDLDDESTYNYYRNTPWEVEAYDGQAALAQQIKESI